MDLKDRGGFNGGFGTSGSGAAPGAQVSESAKDVKQSPSIDRPVQANADRGRGRGRGGRGGGGRGGSGRGGRGGGGPGGDKKGRAVSPEKEWIPVTKLGRLVKNKKITSINEIYFNQFRVQEHEMINILFPEIKVEVLHVMPTQKEKTVNQKTSTRTRFKAFVAVGDYDGHVGFGVGRSKEVQSAVRRATDRAKLHLVVVRRGYWGHEKDKPRTLPCKVTGQCQSSVLVRLMPAPRGTGIVAHPMQKKLLELAGIEDCYACAVGQSYTVGDLVMATFFAIKRTWAYLTPNFWEDGAMEQSKPHQISWDYLKYAITNRFCPFDEDDKKKVEKKKVEKSR